MTTPEIIQQLVKRFEEHKETYRSGRYNETQLRREFLDPFFEALGWDVFNKLGYAEMYKDVVHEDSLEIEGENKAPDYAFRIGGQRKFFVEAKKPAVKIETDIHPAFQLRRYAWSAKLPLSILSDFEELAVYDCRAKPDKKDKASVGRVKLYSYKEYVEKWDEIAGIFAREAVLKGSFDAFAEGTRLKKGTAEVDDAFLAEIERWRDLLATNIATNNQALSVRELNYAVQMTIDRLVFLRICEDRGVERDEQLKEIGANGNVYENLCLLFKRADARYNSGLFHFSEEKDASSPTDSLTLTLKIDDKPLKDIIKNLYYPESPYVFREIPADILGQVYERFLGKVIRLTAGHRAKVEEKPEVRKAGGVYYTPTYIVEYIVENTVGKLVAGKTPKEVEKLRVLDPACGSGTFPLGAYQYLLDWHLKWYMDNEPQKWATGKKPVIFESKDGYRLTTSKKKDILLNNIYGVDIDPQAVEVTKLSLLLKVLEGESHETIGSQLALFQERVLPDLGRNIKCGNSLIGPDYYEGRQLTMLVDEEERYRVNAFDWKAEFSQVFIQGGFDAVIGNPPYIFAREQLVETERIYFSAHYKLSWEKQNTFMLFMELLLNVLRANGKGGYIVPNSWLTIESAKNLRPALIPKLELLADLNYQVFKKVSMEPCVFVLSENKLDSEVEVFRVKSKNEFENASLFKVNREKWVAPNFRIVFSQSINSDVIDSILIKSKTIEDVFDVRTGLQAYEKGKGSPPQSAEDVDNHVFDRDKWENEDSFKYLQGKDVGRYSLNWSGMWMQYGPWLSQPREFEIFSRPRVLIREITSEFPKCINAMFVTGDYLNNKSVLNILHPENDENELKLLTLILNSRLLSLFYKSRAVKSERKIFPKVVIKNLREFPYPSFIKEDAKKRGVALLERMLALHKSPTLPSPKSGGLGGGGAEGVGGGRGRTPQEQEMLKREIESTDRAIDRLVYELYGLSEEEIGIVEGS
jgi:type I restriction-modification system DNA methylase subunit